ncbi:MAG: zinc-binding alcohol dehydrogenase family protein [Fimbriiglobus sp.]
MKAIQLQAPQKFAVIDVDDPPYPNHGEALVRVHRVGVCGTDISGYLGKMPFFTYPRIPGHELGIEVLAVGSEVSHIRVGDRCSVEPYMHCGTCYACRKGATNCCANLKVLGVMTDGGLRDRFIVPAHKLHPANGLSYEQLALVETLAIGCHAVNRAGLQAHETCLIIGAGPIGLATLEFVKLTGAKTAILDTNAERLKFCREVMGAQHTLSPSAKVTDDLRSVFDGDLPDVVIDATGHNGSMSAAFGYIAPTGRLVFVGITTQEVTFTHPTFHRPEGTLLCSRNALPDDFRRILKLIGEGTIVTDHWITHRTPMASMIDVFPSYTKPETGVIKAMIEVN